MEYIVLLGRLFLGGYFLYSGYNHFRRRQMMTGYAQSKSVPSPKNAVMGTGVLLLTGGVSILLGAYPVIGVIALTLFLVPVSFWIHAYWKVPDPMAKMVERVNFQKNFALLGAVLCLLAIPRPWALSLF